MKAEGSRSILFLQNMILMRRWRTKKLLIRPCNNQLNLISRCLSSSRNLLCHSRVILSKIRGKMKFSYYIVERNRLSWDLKRPLICIHWCGTMKNPRAQWVEVCFTSLIEGSRVCLGHKERLQLLLLLETLISLANLEFRDILNLQRM